MTCGPGSHCCLCQQLMWIQSSQVSQFSSDELRQLLSLRLSLQLESEKAIDEHLHICKKKDSACPYTHIRLLSEDLTSCAQAVHRGKSSLNEPFKLQVWCMLYNDLRLRAVVKPRLLYKQAYLTYLLYKPLMLTGSRTSSSLRVYTKDSLSVNPLCILSVSRATGSSLQMKSNQTLDNAAQVLKCSVVSKLWTR